MRFFLSILLITSLYSVGASAKDLVDAAQSAQAMFNRIGVAAISIGITGGGILFAIGLGHIGRMVLMSGLIGAACVLGGPGIISLLGKIFGMSL